MRLFLLFVALTLCPALAVAAAPERFGQSDNVLFLNARQITRWQQDDVTMLRLSGDVKIYQGTQSLQSTTALAWFQEKGETRASSAILTVYLEHGTVTRQGVAQPIKAAALFQSFPATGLVLEGAVTAAGDAPVGDEFIIRAEAFRRGETIAPRKSSALDLLRPSAEEMTMVETPDGGGVVTLRGNAQVSGANMVVKADTIRARLSPRGESEARDQMRVRSIYAEGGVELRRETEMIIADELYLDIPNETGLATNARVRGRIGTGGLPVQFYAATVREVSRYRFVVEGSGYFSTSAFAEPHYKIEGQHVEVVTSPAEHAEAGEPARRESIVVSSHDNLFYVGALPILYWPYIAKDVRSGAFLIKSAEFGHSNNLGTFARISWDLYDLAYSATDQTAFAVRDKSSLSLLTDYYSGRGPGAGLDFKYKTPERLGFLRAYYVHDEAKFDDEDLPTPQTNRGEFTLRHREFLTEHWRADAEIGYLSDRNFLRTYNRDAWDTDKDRETEFFARHLYENQMVTFQARERVNNFQNEVDREGVGYHLVGEQVFSSPLLWTTDTDLSRLRKRSDGSLDEPGVDAIGRFDTAHEVEYPFQTGPFKLDPFVWGDATGYTDTADESGSTGRLAAAAGFRAGTNFYRTFDVRNEFLGVDGLRHIITPVFEYRDIFAVSKEPSEFIQNDEIDALDEAQVATIGVRNRLQTHRFINGERTLTDLLMTELDYSDYLSGRVPNTPRDSHVDLTVVWQATENVRISSEDNRYNTARGRLEGGNAELNLDFWKPITLGFIYKYYLDLEAAGNPPHSVVSTDIAYEPLYSRWKVEFITSYDFDSSTSAESDTSKNHKLGTGVFFTRYLEDWAVRFGMEFNQGRANESAFTFNVIPPGFERSQHPYATTGLYYY